MALAYSQQKAAEARKPVAEAFGPLLKAERQGRGLGLQQVATSLGVHPLTLRRYESGERLPGPAALKWLKRHFGIEPLAD